jgi:hypothetical protein
MLTHHKYNTSKVQRRYNKLKKVIFSHLRRGDFEAVDIMFDQFGDKPHIRSFLIAETSKIIQIVMGATMIAPALSYIITKLPRDTILEVLKDRDFSLIHKLKVEYGVFETHFPELLEATRERIYNKARILYDLGDFEVNQRIKEELSFLGEYD